MKTIFHTRLFRYSYLLGLLGCFLLLSACTPQAPDTSTSDSDSPVVILNSDDNGTEILSYQIIVPADDIGIGEPRVPFILYDGFEQVADVQTIAVNVYDLSDSSNPVLSWSGDATAYTDYKVPYWVVYPDIPTAGIWGFEAAILDSAGNSSTAQFTIATVEDTAAPDIGELVPASSNRTLQTVDDIALLTSGIEPNPALYQMTVAEILEAGKPAVITFNTPAYCQTAFCAPVINAVEDSYDTYNDQANFAHLEIFKEFDPLIVADEVEEWGLPSEPWTFVIDADGRVTARIAGPVSPSELATQLEKIVQ